LLCVQFESRIVAIDVGGDTGDGNKTLMAEIEVFRRPKRDEL
jgi:hypothetical protein